MPNNKNCKDYAVGYSKPPRHTQFKPGQSGNSGGRPKKERSLDSALDQALRTPVTVRENGKERVLSGLEAVAVRLVADAIQGKASALKLLLSLAERRSTAETTTCPEKAEDARQALREKIDLMAKRMQQTSDPDEE